MFVSQTCDRKMTIIPFDPTSIASINGTEQSGMKRSNDGQPDVRGGDLRTSVPVVFSPYKQCLSLFANINDCHGQSWPDPTRARSIWVRERSNTQAPRGTNTLHYSVGRITLNTLWCRISVWRQQQQQHSTRTSSARCKTTMWEKLPRLKSIFRPLPIETFFFSPAFS